MTPPLKVMSLFDDIYTISMYTVYTVVKSIFSTFLKKLFFWGSTKDKKHLRLVNGDAYVSTGVLF